LKYNLYSSARASNSLFACVPWYQPKETHVIIVHAIVKPAAASDGSTTATVRRQLLEPSELQIPPSAIWIDLIVPTVEEDRKVADRERSSGPRAIRVSATKFVPTSSMRSAAKTKRSQICAKASCRSSAFCSS